VAGLQGHSVPHPLDHEELLHEVVQRARHDGTPVHTGPQHCQTCSNTQFHMLRRNMDIWTLAREEVFYDAQYLDYCVEW
jgi:hypothetical protein